MITTEIIDREKALASRFRPILKVRGLLEKKATRAYPAQAVLNYCEAEKYF